MILQLTPRMRQGNVHAEFLILTSYRHVIFIQRKERKINTSFLQLGELFQNASVPISASVLVGLLHPPTHQAGEDCHHHFGLDLHEVFWESVDTGSDLPRHRDGISGKDGEVDSYKTSWHRVKSLLLCFLLVIENSYLAFSSLSSSERLLVFTSS